eukprot:614707-Pyramimonas_sp.AAC.1
MSCTICHVRCCLPSCPVSFLVSPKIIAPGRPKIDCCFAFGRPWRVSLSAQRCSCMTLQFQRSTSFVPTRDGD